MEGKAEFRIFVSPAGKDTWSGLLDHPNADKTDGPFAAITRVRDAIRELKRNGLFDKPVRVVVRGGMYQLQTALEFTHDDSGTTDCPITYCAYPGEIPVFSGGERITGWQPDMVNGQPCWSTYISAVAQGKWYFAQLFVNGVRRPRTRSPKTGFHRFADLPDGRYGFGLRPKSAVFTPGNIRNWHNLEDVETVVLQHWFDCHFRIDRVDEQKCLVGFKTPGLADFNDEQNLNARYYVENIFEELTEPGQWYLDRSSGRLYYIPLSDEDINNTEIIAPRLEYLVQFAGDQDHKTSNIFFENLHFQHCEWRLPVENPGAQQSAFIVPGAITMRDAENCIIRGCYVSRIGQYAIELQRGCRDNKILSCEFYDLGAGGVKICHETPLRDAPDTTGMAAFSGLDPERLGWITKDNPLPRLLDGTYTEVADCTIRDGGLIYHSAVGVWIGNSGYNYVHHNHIYNFYYSGISAGWTWRYVPTRTIRNRIEYNHIHDIGRGLLSDMAGIYFLGINPGSTIIGNVIHDVNSYDYGGYGLYTDEASSYITVVDNIVYRVKSGCYHHHFGHDNIVRNNIFAFSKESQVVRTRADSIRSFTFKNNLLYCDTGCVFGGNWTNKNVLLDSNLYWNPNGGLNFVGLSFDQWQACGHDIHSIIADPRFKNPQADDFTLLPGSPALSLGFKPIDMHKAGTRLEGNRTACDMHHEISLVQTEIVQAELADISKQIDISLTITPGEPKSFILVVRNYGLLPASGQIKLTVNPPQAGHIMMPAGLKYDLHAGQTAEFAFTATLHEGASHIFIQTCPDEPSVIPNSLMVLSKNLFKAQISRVDSGLPFDRIKDIVSKEKSLSATWLSQTVANIRWIIVHDCIALLCKVVDHNLEYSDRPWRGSCIEFFAAMPNDKTGTQVFLLPQTQSHPAQALRWQDGAFGEPRIMICSTPTTDGYELLAQIPLNILKLDSACRSFLIELSITTSLAAGSAKIHVPLFGASHPSASTKGYGCLTILYKRSLRRLEDYSLTLIKTFGQMVSGCVYKVKRQILNNCGRSGR